MNEKMESIGTVKWDEFCYCKMGRTGFFLGIVDVLELLAPGIDDCDVAEVATSGRACEERAVEFAVRPGMIALMAWVPLEAWVRPLAVGLMSSSRETLRGIGEGCGRWRPALETAGG